MPEIDKLAINAKFQTDLDKIATDLIAAYALKFGQNVENLNSPLHRWLDFRFRFVVPQPRQVVFSDRFPKTDLPDDARAGLDHFIRLIQQGSDINPYQGRGLILRNDTSGEKKDARTDLLWADWGVFHFHLTAAPIPDNQFFSQPADYLAFCLVDRDVIAFIDVLPHPDKQGFANPDLMEIVHRNWPAYLEQFAAKGIVAGPKGSRTQEEVHALRTHGICSLLTFGDKVYVAPGMGITSASTSTKVSLVANLVRRYIDELAEMVCSPTGQFQAELSCHGVSEPRFSLALTPGGLAVYEEVTTIAFLLPKRRDGGESTFLEKIRELIAPDWAVAHLVSATQ
ncbi:MAG: hypothetical protein KGI81_04605 [Betaproteobacteria bacterium]|nr:hypothetical protein [Betaproteobacteria bacterium]